MIVQRELLNQIKIFIKRKEFIAITGPRQCGKSTFLEIIRDYLIKEIKIDRESINILTFEDRKLLAQFESDPVEFVNSYLSQNTGKTTYLMLDEFQYAEEGGQKLKLIYDTVKNVKIIITGSSSLEIKGYMVGRILTFNLYPFSFKEYLNAKDKRFEKIYVEKNKMVLNWLFKRKKPVQKIGQDLFADDFNKLFEKYCIWGGYPAVVLSKTTIERKKVLNDIYNNYLLKDIKGLLELTTERNLVLLAQFIAAQISNILVYQNMSQASGLEFRQLKKHLNILQETFICKEVSQYFKNKQKELVKNPKAYFLDLGFRNNLLDSMNNNFIQRTDTGAIVENVIFIRLSELSQGRERINFWRTKTGSEIDFIFKINGYVVPIEVKYSNFDRPQVTRSFIGFIDTFHPRQGVILTKNYWGLIKRNNTEILFAPVYYL